MARSTESIVAGIQHAYENTDQPLPSIGADFHISARTVQRMAAEFGWKKRSERVRALPQAMQLEKQVAAMAAQQSASPALPVAAGEASSAGATDDAPTDALAVIERRVSELLAEEKSEHAGRDARDGGFASQRSAHTLASLTRILQMVMGMRAGRLRQNGSLTDDDMPLDLDEFRLDLARRIEAFVASRTDPGDTDGAGTAAGMDKV